MRQWSVRVIQYLAGFMILSGVHCTVVALVLARDRGTFVYSLVYLPVIILLSEAQKRTKHLWQYMIWAAVTVAMVNFIGRSSYEKKLSIVLTIVAVLFYFYARAKKTDCILDTPGYAFLGLFIIMYFLERQFPSVLLERYAIIGAGIYLLLCMYKINLDEMNQVFDIHGKLERFPEKRLLKNNLLMMGMQTTFVGVGMFAAMFVGVDGLVDLIRDIFVKIIVWILELMKSSVKPNETLMPDGKEELIFIEAKEQSIFMQFFLKLLDVMMTVFVIAVVAYIIYRILKKLYQLYLDFDMNASENGDQIEKIYNIQTKEEKRSLRKKATERLLWDQTPNARIRKYYKKRVLTDWGNIPKLSMTPKELECKIKMDEKGKDTIHTLYEKARYGNVECTKDEVMLMKKMING